MTRRKTNRQSVETREAPAAIGPYAQGLRTGQTLYCSGQIPLDPASGELVAGDFRAQAERVLDNLESVLRAGGMTLADVVRTTVYLTSLTDFPVFNEVYATRFSEPYPARVTVGIASLPKGARVEMDAIAVADD